MTDLWLPEFTKHVFDPYDGVWSRGGSACVRALQARLNDGHVL